MTGTETVIVVGPTEVDRYGDPVAGTPTRQTVPGCILAPRPGAELTANGRQGVIVGLTLYAPPGTALTARHTVEARGDTWKVEGEPGDWRQASTGVGVGVEAALERVEG